METSAWPPVETFEWPLTPGLHGHGLRSVLRSPTSATSPPGRAEDLPRRRGRRLQPQVRRLARCATTCKPSSSWTRSAHAVTRRRPGTGLVHHSDRGSRYASPAFGATLCDSGITTSMGSRGDVYEGALAESFMVIVKKDWSTGAPSRRRTRQARDLRLHRMPLQPGAVALDARRQQPHELRTRRLCGDHLRSYDARSNTGRQSGATPTPAIHSTIASLRRQMCLGQHLAESPDEPVSRIVFGMLVLTLGMFLSALLGPPLRSSVAFEGRSICVRPLSSVSPGGEGRLQLRLGGGLH